MHVHTTLESHLISILQPDVIDVSGWVNDEIYFNYPEGARSKNALFPPEQACPLFIVSNRRYLYKRSDKKYPDQFWGEVVAYHVGGLLGVTVPPAYAAYNSLVGDCGSLIEWFYEDGKAQFIPGGQYMQRLMPEFDRKRGAQHNFHSINTLGRWFTQAKLFNDSWEQYWSDAFLFDALIGNTDRHQDNWGCMFVKQKSKAPVLTLAPLFDNGTSLGHERFPERLANWTDADFARYVDKGTHHVKWLKDDAKSCGHIELLTKMVESFPSVAPNMREKINSFDISLLNTTLDSLCALPLLIPLAQGRKNLYIKLLQVRLTNIKAALK